MQPTTAVRLHRSDSLAHTAYAHAASAVGATRPVLIAGACPLAPDGSVLAPDDIEEQTRQCLLAMDTALASAAAAVHDVAYTRILVATTDRADLVRVWRVVEQHFGGHDVPSTLHGVTVLGYPGQLVEIEAVAFPAAPLP